MRKKDDEVANKTGYKKKGKGKKKRARQHRNRFAKKSSVQSSNFGLCAYAKNKKAA